jgi:soluble cytochrome b562
MTTRTWRFAALGLLSAALSTPALAQNGNQPEKPGQGGNAGQQQRGQGQNGNRPQQGRGNRGGNPEMIADRMMQADADGDGKVSKAEASGGNAQRMFDQADADGDGFITRVEIITFIQSRSGNRGGGRGEDMARPGGDRAGGDRAGSPAAAKPVDPKEAFHEAMEASGRALRGLRRAKFDAISKETDLAAIRTIQSSLMIAKQHTAAIPMSDAAKEKFGTDAKAYQMAFQIDLIKAIMGALQVEMAVLQGDAEKAKAAVANIVTIRSDSHDVFEE